MTVTTHLPGGLTGSRPRPRPETRSRRHNAAFWIVGYTFAVTMAFSALPTPLYVLYQARDGFSTFLITVIFAAYAVGVVASLFLAGHLSDWAGRRRMVLLAVLVNMFSGVLFLLWPATAGLIVARLVSGVSVGMLTATATAYLSELHAAARPGAGRGRSEIVATAANLGGIGLGPLLSGVLAQYLGHALVLPYLVSEALMLIGAVALAAAPETAEVPSRRPAYRPQRVTVPAAQRPLFLAATTAAGVVFALFGVFTSVAPSLLAGVLHNDSHAVAGAVAFAVFGAGAAAQIAVSRAARRTQAGLGLAALVAGLAMVTAAAWLPSFWLLVAGGIVAGAGAGAAFRGTVATVIAITPPRMRGEGLAGLFLGAYVGLAIPVVGLGVATLWVSLPVAVLGLAVALTAAVLPVARRLLALAARDDRHQELLLEAVVPGAVAGVVRDREVVRRRVEEDVVRVDKRRRCSREVRHRHRLNLMRLWFTTPAFDCKWARRPATTAGADARAWQTR